MKNTPAAPMAFADTELDWLIMQSRKSTETRYTSAYTQNKEDRLPLNKSTEEKLQIYITRGMIALSLSELAGMKDADAWEFSNALDMSIEEDYLPENDLLARFELVKADCAKFVEGKK